MERVNAASINFLMQDYLGTGNCVVLVLTVSVVTLEDQKQG